MTRHLFILVGLLSLIPVALPAVDPAALESHVRKLAINLAPRDYTHLENLNRVVEYLKKHLSAAGGRLSEQLFYLEEWNRSNHLVRLGPYRNVIASFGPEDGERIIVGAHYDAYGAFPAADDNASGVAALLELARLLGAHPPAVRTDLVAYNTEEPPFFATHQMGSVFHADSLKTENVNVRGMICLETIGYFSDQPASQSYPMPILKLFYPTQGSFITVVGGFKDRQLVGLVRRAMRKAAPLPVQSILAPAWLPGIDFSDHRSYWASGYRAVMITDTAFYRNKAYHTSQDTPERLDYARMAMVVQGVYEAVIKLAERL